jgi:poly(beta-D-mannuronate) lyase
MENCRRLPPALPSSPVCRLVAAFVLLMLQAIATAMAHTVVVDSADAFNRAVAAAKPGDVIDIANGRYDSWKIEVPKTVSGSTDERISLQPPSAGAVTYSGDSQLTVFGSYVEIAGLTFDGAAPRSVDIHGNHNRLTASTFHNAGDRDNPHQPIIVMEFGASDNEIDNCRFVGSESVSIQVKVPTDDRTPLPLNNYIHNNHFQDIQKFSKNGQEPIQLGQREEGGHHELWTRVEYNSFTNVNADSELISVKSSHNFIRYNFATDSAAGLTLRRGHGNLVEGNVLIRTKRGIVVTGDEQTVINNFIDSPQEQGILIAVGSKRFDAATNSIVAHNTVVNAKWPLLFALRDPDMTNLPKGNKIVNNILIGSGEAPAVATKGELPLGAILPGNIVDHNLMSGSASAVNQGLEVNRSGDASLDLSDPKVPKLRADSQAHDGALPGYASQDIVKTVRGGANGLPDIGAFELPGP